MKKSDYIIFCKKINALYSKKVCFASEISCCSIDMTNAHTIQNKRSLENIAENDHVCGFINNEDLNSEKPFVFSDKISINKASTFHGFCQRHDDELFKDLDTGYFLPTEKQVYLLMFRTIAWQLYNNYLVLQSRQQILDLYEKENRLLSEFENNLFISKASIIKILTSAMRLMINAIKMKDFSCIQYVVIQTSTIPEVMTSGAFIPDNLISSLSETDKIKYIDVNTISLNILSDGKNGFIVLSWLTDYKHNNENYLSKLIQCNNPLNKIMEICFYQLNENTYFSKNWWNHLSTDQKNILQSIIDIIQLSQDDIHIKPSLDNIVNWEIVSIKTNNHKLAEIIT